jgi:ABC-type phosphate transport system substrate-binding protein
VAGPLLFVPADVPAADGEYKIIVSATSDVQTVRKRDLAKIFLRKVARWSDGKDAQPVDQSFTTPVRAAFTKDVLRSEGLGLISAVESYWTQQVYSGRNSPPPVKSSDAEVVKFVAANPGAVGYVKTDARLEGVKALAVQD